VITQGSLGARIRELAERVQQLVHRYEPVSRVVNHVNTLEAFDLSLVLAAQAFLTIVPLLIVLAAFTPRMLGIPMSNELQAALGLSNSSLAFRDMLGVPGHAARVGGALGFALVVAAGLSTATALQRGYERIWSLRRLGVLRSAWRSAAWLAACVLAFGLSGLADDAIKDMTGSNELLILIALVGAFLFWWWTPHLLLAARIPWRTLVPGAVATGGVLVALLWISPLLMPGFVTSSEYEFGPLGTVFVVMLWLTIVCSIVVFCAIAGQVVTTMPRLSRLLHLTPAHEPGGQPAAAIAAAPPGGNGQGAAAAAEVITGAGEYRGDSPPARGTETNGTGPGSGTGDGTGSGTGDGTGEGPDPDASSRRDAAGRP
jgi:membrane protein